MDKKWAKKSTLKKFKNCKAKPVIKGGLCRVFLRFSIAPLHLMIGVVNKLVGLLLKIAKEVTEAWLKQLKVVKKGKNRQFNGNHCRYKLLLTHV